MKFRTDIYGPQRMNHNDFGDLLDFPLVLPDQITFFFFFFSEMSQQLLDGLQ